MSQENNEQIEQWIADLTQQKAEKKVHEARASTCGENIRRLEAQIIAAMDDKKLTDFGSEVARVTLSESVVPQTEDRDAFLRSVVNTILNANNAGAPMDELTHELGVFEFRPSVTRFREELELGRQRPGVTPYTKRTVRVYVK